MTTLILLTILCFALAFVALFCWLLMSKCRQELAESKRTAKDLEQELEALQEKTQPLLKYQVIEDAQAEADSLLRRAEQQAEKITREAEKRTILADTNMYRAKREMDKVKEESERLLREMREIAHGQPESLEPEEETKE